MENGRHLENFKNLVLASDQVLTWFQVGCDQLEYKPSTDLAPDQDLIWFKAGLVQMWRET